MKNKWMEPLRGLAALWVFSFHHAFSNSFQHLFPLVSKLSRYGYLGIPMFFVISGFCITASAQSHLRQSGNAAWKAFLIRRARRIFPTYWFSILVTLSIPFLAAAITMLKSGHFASPAPAFLDFSMLDWISFASLTRVFQYSPGADVLSDKFLALNAVYWTLAIEVQFYAVVTLIIAAGRDYHRTTMALTLLSIPFLFAPHWILISGLFLPWWPMFAVGIGLHWILEQGKDFGMAARKMRLLSALACVAAVVGMAHIGSMQLKFLSFTMGFASLLISAQDLEKSTPVGIRSRHSILGYALVPITLLGEMSYSLYLLHVKFADLARQLLYHSIPIDTATFDFSLILLTSLFCYGFYLACERPFLSTKGPKA